MSTSESNGQPQILALWPDGVPGLSGSELPEQDAILPNGLTVVRNVTRPTLTVYLPDPAIATGTAMIVCPGGAFHFLAYEHEGIAVARWLTEHGVAAFLLRYRLIPTGDDFPEIVGSNLRDRAVMSRLEADIYPKIAADGLQAVGLLRARAGEWGIDPHRIGIMGFSAGGVVTSMVAMQYDARTRPDFAAPIYSAPPPEAPVPADAPALFLLCAGDDGMAVPVAQKLFTDWRAGGHAAELHIYAQGGHGFGMNPQGLPSDGWIERLGDWLRAQGLLQRASGL
jgi:acetyl esterase/lipase